MAKTARPKEVKTALPLFGGELYTPDEKRKSLTGKRFVLTAAQNNTRLHENFWKTLQNFCKVNDAQLGIAKFTYNKNGWQKITADSEGLWYDERIEPYVISEQVKVANGLLFCAELDILPTAVMPLQGLDNYTGPNSALVPHTKVQMKSLATMMHEPAKLMYTTGAVTLRNYIDRKAGQVATFHHVFGALYVEVDSDGDWFVRQLNADEDGTVFDLDRVYIGDKVQPAATHGQPYVTLGDVHLEKLDAAAWEGASQMLRDLQPSRVFLHDLIDFERRNHHNVDDKMFLLRQYVQKPNNTVEHTMYRAADFLRELERTLPSTLPVVVRSNHDEAFERWLKDGTKWPDPENMRYWHEWNYRWMQSVERGEEIDVYASAIRYVYPGYTGLRTQFLLADESMILRDIEHGMHGHLGARGGKGTPMSFRQMGRKSNTGHTHSAGIIDGQWTAGLLAEEDMGYNRGLGSSSVSHIITHPNGKRQMVTQRGMKYRA